LEERPAGQRDVSFVMSTFDYLQLSWQAAGRWVGGYQGVEECIKKSHHATWQHHQQKWPKQLETYVCIRSSCRKLVGNYIKTYVFFLLLFFLHGKNIWCPLVFNYGYHEVLIGAVAEVPLGLWHFLVDQTSRCAWQTGCNWAEVWDTPGHLNLCSKVSKMP
jgi:hypothetical protein